MSTISLSLDEIYDLAKKTLVFNGCDEENASILADTIMRAERDGSHSHGLFRLPAYVAALKSKKVNGKARPEIKKISSSIIKVLGNNAFAPMVLKVGLPELIKLAKETGVAVLAITNSHHMAALWPETEAVAESGLVGFACTSYMPLVAPAGAKKALFGTNPISFAWPRPGKTPVVYDMATSAMAMGDVMVAARDGKKVPLGTGINKEGKETMEIHKDSIDQNDSVLLIDDLIATGGTAEAAAKLVEISGGKVAGFLFVINLFDLNGIKKLKDKGYVSFGLLDFPGH